ncbi:S24/S26 family peptidase [Azohydromonas lata]|uniref:Peptidase S24/S26A/S26B/S26C domain-containing protein n=1 Tax=Azohydromonas lata TaxID=45677 RepID=A0ABU5IIP6_9BURK|nr:hypothetical protein [Azohydromonas lata]MDZ5457893.1 hypothetical protein [Azohydromonas lata]
MNAALNLTADGVHERFMLPVTSDAEVWPRYRVGEFVVIEPGTKALPGDDVVVTLHDGCRLLRELVTIDPAGIVLEDNAGTVTALASDSVLQVAPVVGRMSRAMALQHMCGAEVAGMDETRNCIQPSAAGAPGCPPATARQKNFSDARSGCLYESKELTR